MKQKSRGGKRPGSGRKKKSFKNVAITLYIHPEVVENYGGKEHLRDFFYSFTNPADMTPVKPRDVIVGPVVHSPEGLEFTRKQMESIQKKYSMPPPSAAEDRMKESLDNLHNDALFASIKAIQAEKCPKERDTLLGRKAWQMEQDKRIQELKNQLK